MRNFRVCHVQRQCGLGGACVLTQPCRVRCMGRHMRFRTLRALILFSVDSAPWLHRPDSRGVMCRDCVGALSLPQTPHGAHRLTSRVLSTLPYALPMSSLEPRWAVRSPLLAWSARGLNVSCDEAGEAGKLCEVSTAFLWTRARRMLVGNRQRPTVFSYAPDSTPLTVQEALAQRRGQHRVSVRRGGGLTEFLMQSGFRTRTGVLGQPLVVRADTRPRTVGGLSA